MSNYGRYEQGQPTGGDIAVQMWAEACGEEELERIRRFFAPNIGQVALEEPTNEA
jgi:hypothetical protein